MLRKVHPTIGLSKIPTYDELVNFIETDETKIKLPNRAAYFRRFHPFMTQDDGVRTVAQRRQLDHRMGDNNAPYQPERHRARMDPPSEDDYDPTGDIQDMFARAYQPPMAPTPIPDVDRNGLGAEGFEAPALPNEQQMQLPLAPAEPSLLSRATSRVGQNASQGVLNAVSQYSQDTAAAALGWMGRHASEAFQEYQALTGGMQLAPWAPPPALQLPMGVGTGLLLPLWAPDAG